MEPAAWPAQAVPGNFQALREKRGKPGSAGQARDSESSTQFGIAHCPPGNMRGAEGSGRWVLGEEF